MSSTPIFDQLAAELLEGKGVRYESLTATAPINLRPVQPSGAMVWAEVPENHVEEMMVKHLSVKMLSDREKAIERAEQYRQSMMERVFSQPLPPEQQRKVNMKKRKYAGPKPKLVYIDEFQITPEETPKVVGSYIDQVMEELRAIHPRTLMKETIMEKRPSEGLRERLLESATSGIARANVDEIRNITPHNLVGDFVMQVMEELKRKHPSAVFDTMETQIQLDGSLKVTARGLEPSVFDGINVDAEDLYRLTTGVMSINDLRRKYLEGTTTDEE